MLVYSLRVYREWHERQNPTRTDRDSSLINEFMKDLLMDGEHLVK